MRRSKAPSVLNKGKQIGENDSCSDLEEQYDWGSRNFKSKKFNKYKRIFKVVWRDISTRKHKVWKGDGFLEVDDLQPKAILKDEKGKYMGCSTKVDINGLVPDYQMIISGKEIEIQNEIVDYGELQNLREMQIENENTLVKDKTEETKKPKGVFTFKPILVLKSPNLTSAEKTIKKENDNYECKGSDVQNQFSIEKRNDTHSGLCSPSKIELFNEYICFLKPSELQQLLFQKVLKYVSISKTDNESIDAEIVLKLICNHPSLINHKTSTNELLLHLIPLLPDWTEMGPFDSTKLEFVQYFLTDLTRSNPQTCTILAKNPNVLNMLQGLCDFLKIDCLRLDANNLQNCESQILNFCAPEDGSTHVILGSSLQILSNSKFPTYCKKIIVFEEYLEFSNVNLVRNFNDLTIYYLVTAFSIEELFLGTYTNIVNSLNDLNNMNKEYDCCYFHSKIECSCFKSTEKILNTENDFIKYWNHFKPPFDLQLLKLSSLENSSENIVSIFCKKK